MKPGSRRKKGAPRNDVIAGTSGSSSARHDDRAGTPNGPHRIESPDHRGQILCKRRLLAENYGETQRTSSKMTKAREEGKIAYLSFDKLVVRDRD